MSGSLKVDQNPFASGGYADVYEGTLGTSRVCVKRVRVYIDDREMIAKVCYRHCCLSCSPSLIQPAELLPGDRDVEKIGPLEHPPPTRDYHLSRSPTHFEFDARRGPAEIPPE